VKSAYRYTFFTKAVTAEDSKEDEEEANVDSGKVSIA
jgi:hypothetical protein